MINIIVSLSRYLFTIIILVFTLQSFQFLKKRDEDEKKYILRKQTLTIVFMNFFAFTVMYLQKYEFTMIIMLLEIVGFVVVLPILYRIFYKNSSLLLINNMCMLLSCGFIMIGRLDFESAQKQLLMVAVGTTVSLLIPVIIRKAKVLKNMTWFYGITGIVMLAVVLVLATVSYGASLSIEIAGITFQLSEFVKITYVFFLAGMLSNKTDFRTVAIATIGAGLHVIILVLSRDLGNALVYFIAYAVIIYVATKNPLYGLASLLGGSVAAVVAYSLFAHVRKRVTVWEKPFADPMGAGYQTVQSLFGIAAGGWFGTGLFRGSPTSIPVVTKDFIFAAICEELGTIFGICLLIVCMTCFILIVNIAMRMSNKFYKLIALGLGTQYAFQVFLTVGGSINFIPLTGITLPLVSYGGSSVISTIIMFSIVQGLYVLREDESVKLEGERIEKEKQATEQKRTQAETQDSEISLEERIEEQTQKSLRW